MNDKTYAIWKQLQNDANEAMAVVDKGREAGPADAAGWRILAKRAIALQELAIDFAKVHTCDD